MNLIYVILVMCSGVVVAGLGCALIIRHGNKVWCPKNCLDLRTGVRKGVSMAFCTAYCKDLNLNRGGCIKKCPECIQHIKQGG